MKILLDECLPQRLVNDFPNHDAFTVPYLGWAGIKNGKLLALIEANSFAAFITSDRNLSFQQNLEEMKFLVIVLRANTNRYSDLKIKIPEILRILEQMSLGIVEI